MLNQERAAVEQEKNRVQMLLQGMHNVMTAYNASGNLPAPAPAVKSAVVAVPKPTLGYKSQPGTTFAPTLVVFFLIYVQVLCLIFILLGEFY